MGDGDGPERSEVPGWALVMPFTAVASKGGPYDDAAFAAGWQCGQIYAELQALSVAGGCYPTVMTTMRPVRATTVKQLDLVAMSHGFRLKTEATDVDEWVMATFSRVPPPPGQSAADADGG